MAREQLRLHFLCDGDLVLQALLFLLLHDQLLDGFGHQIERTGQRCELIFRPNGDAVAEICAVDVRRGAIKFCHGASDGTGQASADIQGGDYNGPQNRGHKQ